MGLCTRCCAVGQRRHSSCIICTCGRKDGGRERNFHQVSFVRLGFKNLKNFVPNTSFLLNHNILTVPLRSTLDFRQN